MLKNDKKMLQNIKKPWKTGMKKHSHNLIELKGTEMIKNIRRNTIIKANAPIVKLMNLIWGL